MVEDRAAAKELDQWIEQLMDCKQLAENNVKTLCDKVSFFLLKYYSLNLILFIFIILYNYLFLLILTGI